MPYSKRWWNKEVAKAQKIQAKEKKQQEQILPDRKRLKKARNAFYCLIRKVKREYQQNFLESEKKILEPDKTHLKDKNWCWIALQYTKLKINTTTPILIGPNNKRAFTIQAKEALVRAHVFLPPPVVYCVEYQPSQGSAHS